MFFYFVSFTLSSLLLILSLIFNILTIPLINEHEDLKKEVKAIKIENTKLILDITEQTRFEAVEAFSEEHGLVRPKKIYYINK